MMYKVRIMISKRQGVPRKYTDLIQLYQDSVYMSDKESNVCWSLYSPYTPVSLNCIRTLMLY